MKTRCQRSALLAVLLAQGCTSSSPTPSQPQGWDSSVRLQEALDTNADPHVVETDLTAEVGSLEILAGTQTPAWTYGGTLPGPLLHAKVGDKLIVHFKNNLPEPTTIHWHGLRIDAAMDGAPGHSQPEIPPGGSFDYEFVLPDAGLFWYHPHVNSAVQVGFGLYGAILVDDPDEPADLGDELVMVLSDINLREDGSLENPDSGGNFGTLFGREGNVLLVNGKQNPLIMARSGMRQRWRIVNAAKSRYYQLAMAGHSFTRIGSDAGFIESPVQSAMIVLAPGERADVLVEPKGAAGSILPVRWVPYDRGYGTTFNRPEEELFRIQFSNDPPVNAPALPTLGRNITPIDTSVVTNVSLDLTSDEQNGILEMGINGVPSWEAPPLVAQVGETQLFVVTNTMDFAHPFHLHGFFFQELDELGKPVHPMEWKDTLDIPVKATKRFVVTYDNRPGMWMYHCHILDHADAGMMGMLDLQNGSVH